MKQRRIDPCRARPRGPRPCAVCAYCLLTTYALAGCKSADYQAAHLPDHLRASAVNYSAEVDLARMAGLGQGTSQIAAGDLVELTIASGRGDELAEPVQVRVSRAGQLSVPLVGDVPVAGLEPFEAETRIAAAAIERGVYRQPSVTLKIAEQAVNRVTVLGAVTNPGVYSLPRGSSDLANAIAAAGGMTEEAGTRVDVLRHDAPTFFAEADAESVRQADGVKLASYEPPGPESGAPAASTAARAGVPADSTPRMVRLDLAQSQPLRDSSHQLNDRDVVMVLPREKRLIHVTGLVNQANQFELPRDQDVTVLDAIALAGGISSPVADKVFVIRRLEGMSEPAVIRVSIRKAKRDGNENLRLAPGDLVSVETTPATLLVDTANTFFRMTLGLGSNVAIF